MAVGFALAAGLVKGFTKNIGREAARREKDDARLDKLEEMLFASMLKPVDERPGVDAINSIQDTLKNAKKAQAERGSIDLFGTPGKRIDLDLMKTANLLNEVQGGTLNFGGYKIPVSKLYGTKALLNKPFEQGQEWLRAVNVHINDPMKKALFFNFLKNNEQAKNLFQSEYGRHAKLFLNGYTKNFSVEGSKQGAFTQVADNFSNFADVNRFFGSKEIHPVDVVTGSQLLTNVTPTKGKVYFRATDENGINVLSPFEFQGPDAGRNYAALKTISDRLNYKSPSHFIFDFQSKAPELKLPMGEDPNGVYTYIFDAIELEKMNFSGITRDGGDVNKLAKYLTSRHGNNRFRMALAVMPLIGDVESYSQMMAQNGNIMRGLPRVDEIEQIFNLGKGGAKKIKENYRDAIAVRNDLRELIELRKSLPTGVGVVEKIGSVLTSIFGTGGQIEQVGNLLSRTAGGEDFDADRGRIAVKNFLAKYRTDSDQEKLGRVDSLIISLAARMARAVDPSGRLSNQDFEVQLQRLGNSGLFTNIPRQLAALEETLGDFSNRVNRLKVINDILDGRGASGVSYSLSPTERRLLYADKQVQSLLDSASPEVISNLAGKKFSYQVALKEKRIQTSATHVGPNGEEVEIMFDTNDNQVQGFFFINGKRVPQNQVRFVRPDARQLFAGTETERDPTRRTKDTQTFVGDDPSFIDEDLQKQIKEDPRKLGATAKPVVTQTPPPPPPEGQTGQYPKESTIVRPLGNGQFVISTPQGEKTVIRNQDGSYSDVEVTS